MLGLGVKFCPNLLHPMININKIMERFDRDLHIQSVFTDIEVLMPLANLKIYIRSKWKLRYWEIKFALK